MYDNLSPDPMQSPLNVSENAGKRFEASMPLNAARLILAFAEMGMNTFINFNREQSSQETKLAALNDCMSKMRAFLNTPNEAATFNITTLTYEALASTVYKLEREVGASERQLARLRSLISGLIAINSAQARQQGDAQDDLADLIRKEADKVRKEDIRRN